MNTVELDGDALDYWVARGLHDFVREIHFTDGGETLAIRGNDRGRAWDGRFLPSTSWEAASVVLERACRLEMSDHGRGEVICVARFGAEGADVEGRGISLRIALLRAFVLHSFGPELADTYPRQSQLLLGTQAEMVGEGNSMASAADAPVPDGRIGDIGSTARQ